MLPKNTTIMPLVNHSFIADALYNIADALWFNQEVQNNIVLICKQMDGFVRNDYGDNKLSFSTYCIIAKKSSEQSITQSAAKDVTKEISKIFHLTSAFYSGTAGLNAIGNALKAIHNVINSLEKMPS